LSFRDVEELLAERGIVVISLSIGATGSHVPHKSLKQVHAALMPDAV
jgi:transposase-like protein